jgi:hypothetical protein
MGLCPDCDGEGRTLVTFGALRLAPHGASRMMETVALRECAVCSGAGWFESGRGR